MSTKIPSVVPTMSGIKALANKRMSKKVKFMGEDITIYKLSIEQVLSIQEKAKNVKDDEEANFDLLQEVIGYAVEGGNELTDEDFNKFPIDELSKISNEVMKFSGLDQGK
jgi:transcriptional regulator of met regulon